jgi:integrase
MVTGYAKQSRSNNIGALRTLLETVGKIYDYQHLEKLFLNTDIPPEQEAEFKVYSDHEMEVLNAHITKMDEQIARCMVIHQMLGTRISDTLTLQPDCVYDREGQKMIRIHQVKTGTYEKPISADLALLIQKAAEYTKRRYGETKYIFVNEKNPDRPLQYTTLKQKVLTMIRDENLLDDSGKRFLFGSHLYRHYYGVKLTELHIDDWTLAKLLGHTRLSSVQHYRKMSNQLMADETRAVRAMMSKIIYENLDGWGEEYEQIRQDDFHE